MHRHKSTEIQDTLDSNKPNILAVATHNIPILTRQENLQVGRSHRIIDDTSSQIVKGYDREVCKVHPAILEVLPPVAKNPFHHQASIQLGTEDIND
jgi:hypothetical protein